LEVWVQKDDGVRTALGWASARVDDDAADRPRQLL
jgi:hypothetical protein